MRRMIIFQNIFNEGKMMEKPLKNNQSSSAINYSEKGLPIMTITVPMPTVEPLQASQSASNGQSNSSSEGSKTKK